MESALLSCKWKKINGSIYFATHSRVETPGENMGATPSKRSQRRKFLGSSLKSKSKDFENTWDEMDKWNKAKYETSQIRNQERGN